MWRATPEWAEGKVFTVILRLYNCESRSNRARAAMGGRASSGADDSAGGKRGRSASSDGLTQTNTASARRCLRELIFYLGGVVFLWWLALFCFEFYVVSSPNRTVSPAARNARR